MVKGKTDAKKDQVVKKRLKKYFAPNGREVLAESLEEAEKKLHNKK